jgi:hypothetical protein
MTYLFKIILNLFGFKKKPLYICDNKNINLSEMNIKEKFLELTKRTYPHGTEEEVFPLLGSDLQKDEFGNLFIKIGESDVMFTSHLDTATSALTTVVHTFEDNLIKTDGKSILGADDKAGVTIMLHMIENKIPGLYYFFLGEEVGCVGSKKVAEKQKVEKLPGINKVISFDRRGYDSVITFQSSQRCCSEKFAEALGKELNDIDSTFKYKNDPTGLLTDSIQFIKIYPECTNISVGYKYEHTFSEQQDIEHLEKLAEACLKINWQSLPVERDPSVVEYKSYGYYDDFEYGYGWGSSTTTSNSSLNSFKNNYEKIERIWFYDQKFEYVSLLEVDKWSNKTLKVDFCKERIEYEKEVIEKLLKKIDLHYTSVEWDGVNLKVTYEADHTSICNRNDLIEYLPQFDYSSGENIDDIDIGDSQIKKLSSVDNFYDDEYNFKYWD